MWSDVGAIGLHVCNLPVKALWLSNHQWEIHGARSSAICFKCYVMSAIWPPFTLLGDEDEHLSLHRHIREDGGNGWSVMWVKSSLCQILRSFHYSFYYHFFKKSKKTTSSEHKTSLATLEGFIDFAFSIPAFLMQYFKMAIKRSRRLFLLFHLLSLLCICYTLVVTFPTLNFLTFARVKRLPASSCSILPFGFRGDAAECRDGGAEVMRAGC